MAIRSIIGLVTTLLFLNCGLANAAGPWKGKVIDSETREPIDGAVVFAVWYRELRGPAGSNPYFYEAKETVTDNSGNFELSSYTPINLLPIISYMKGPEFTIFKPGYGSLQMELGDYLAGETLETKEMELSGGVFRLAPGIIELPKARTSDARWRALTTIDILVLSKDIPCRKKKNLARLFNEEYRKISGSTKKGVCDE